MNTTIAFSSPVTVGGKKLPGRDLRAPHDPDRKGLDGHLQRGLHATGAASATTRRTTSLRFAATPRPADFEERLEYRFENLTDNSRPPSCTGRSSRSPSRSRWTRRPIVFDSLKSELHGLGQFFWQPWNEAARWCVQNDYELGPGDPVGRTGRSGIQANFQNLRTKADLLEKKGDAKGAEELRARALKVATEADMNAYGYQLLGQGQDRRGNRGLSQERQGPPRLLEHVRQPGRGPRQKGRQEGRNRELHEGPQHGHGRGQPETDHGPAGQAQGLAARAAGAQTGA